MVLGMLLIGGCIPVGRDTVGKQISEADLGFIELGVTTKSEVVERLGEPYLFVEKHNVFYYHWRIRTDYVVPVAFGTAFRQDHYAVYVQFDSNDHVKRFKRVQEPNKQFPNPEENLKDWLTSE
jgi:outer membrane protein assembly factor BamE (lipoprotein component of BamABCDE complex)